ncbi:MAG: hypothetical protein ROO73_00650 [Roseivirga sp.]
MARRLLTTLSRALYPKKNLSKPDHKASVSSYLLKERPAVKVNDVWQIDIAYLRMEQGFLYLRACIHGL